jgi:ABC-2 type transport system permease protein
MKSLFLLFRPTFLATRNRWTRSVDLRAQAGRDLFLLSFSFLVMLAVYIFTRWALKESAENPALAYLPYSTFLALLFGMLLAMLLISSVLAALGTYFLSDDLELILPTPLSAWRLFLGKFTYVFLVSSWMPFLFATPVLLAFARASEAPLAFYALAPALMIPFLLIPSALGVAVAHVIVLAIPVYRVRETILAVLVAGAAAVYSLIDILQIEWDSLKSAQELLRLMSLVTAPTMNWLPSNWLGQALGELLRPVGVSWEWYGAVLVCTAVASVSLAFLAALLMHDTAYSNIRNKRRGATYKSTGFQRWVRRAGASFSPSFRAMIGKELRVLSRDVSQVVQLFMLLGLALTYLYHLRIFSAVESFPLAIRPWWKNFLFIGNVTMGAFVTTAMCTRFVFPSLSMEGRSFWILQTSPLEIKDFVRMKFWVWFVPISIMAGCFFTAGAVAIGAEPRIVLVCGLSSFVVSYGVVGLAIGFGALFAHFEWEHTSQLAGGFGSLLFMLVSTVLIFLNMVPAWMVLFYAPRIGMSLENISSILLLAALILAVIGVNVQAARIAMRTGTESLLKRYR